LDKVVYYSSSHDMNTDSWYVVYDMTNPKPKYHASFISIFYKQW
jgi:hypothetical protein